MKELISAKWLNSQINDENLILLDASIAATAGGKSSTYSNQTIEGSRYFNLKDDFSDQLSQFTNTLPSEEQFEQECRKLGVNHNSKIIVFDNLGVYSSPRVWWMFKTMGHNKIAVLNGGLKSWVTMGFPIVERTIIKYELGNFKAKFNPHNVVNFKQVKQNIHKKDFKLIDARSEGRFNGTENEPRQNLQSGNIIDSINIPYNDVLENGQFKSKKELKKIFVDKSGDENQLVFSCGSGLTACIVMLANEITHKSSLSIYDGSWTEWAELNNLKKNVV